MPRNPPLSLSPELIRQTRAAMAMTQKEFADYLGVEENTVYRWEANVHMPVGKKARVILDRARTIKRNDARREKGEVIEDNRD